MRFEDIRCIGFRTLEMPGHYLVSISAPEWLFRFLRGRLELPCLLTVLLALLLAACTSEPTATPAIQPTIALAPEATILAPAATIRAEPTAIPFPEPTLLTAPEPTAPVPYATPLPAPTAKLEAVPTAEALAAATPAPVPATEDWLSYLRASSTGIEIGALVQGEIRDQADANYFMYQAHAGQNYQLYSTSIKSFDQSSDSRSPLTLYDSSGMELARIEQESDTNWVAPYTGHYYLAVATNRPDTFELHVDYVCFMGQAEQAWATSDFWPRVDLAQVQVLLKHCPVHIDAPSSYSGESPLLLAAAFNKDPAVIQALLDAGADPEAKDRLEVQPLHWAAAYNENTAVLQTLLDAGADINAREGLENTPLHYAAYLNETPGMINFLLYAGADIEARTVNGTTPLHSAAAPNENPAALQALLDAGADINARNADGETPLTVAIRNDNQLAIQVLQANGDNE